MSWISFILKCIVKWQYLDKFIESYGQSSLNVLWTVVLLNFVCDGDLGDIERNAQKSESRL